MSRFDITETTALRTATGDLKIRQPDEPPPSRTFHLKTPDGTFTFDGVQVGFGTSQRFEHRDHDDAEFMPPGAGRCSACRWFEVRIFIADDAIAVGGSYVIHTLGRSIIPDELEKCRVFITPSEYEVVNFLTVSRNGERFVPQASVRALAQSATWSEQLREAYIALELG